MAETVSILSGHLKNYLPEETAERAASWLIDYKAALKITKPRKTKLGDYRPPHNGWGHRISVNGNLNRYSFLITLTHEIAHLITWEKYRNKVSPHGMQWKSEFKELMLPFINEAVFPEEITSALIQYLKNPAASSCMDRGLAKALKKYDTNEDRLVFLEEIPEEAIFRHGNNRYFRKGKQLRKRFKCKELQSHRYYLIHPMAEVRIVEK